MTVSGAPPDLVRAAIEQRDPFPGTAGFAGELDGQLVRDVLGRYPLFFEQDGPSAWSHEPVALERPQRLPAGQCYDIDSTDSREIWTLPSPAPVSDNEVAVVSVRDALDRTVSAVDTDSLAVAFSGGIDSALLAARLDVPLYAVGFPESHDLEAARSGAALIDGDLHTVTLDHETLEQTVPKVVAATGRTNAMDVAIALPLFVLAERAVADGFDRLALGQGADELFGGYAKVANAPGDHRVVANTVREARRETVRSLPDQFERDGLALRTAGVEPVTPFVHDRVVRAALSLSGEQLVSNGCRKWALREAIRPWLPAEIVTRDKKALQYGTLTSRELDRLARQAGYKRRMDDHLRRYIESLC